jgi:hypothetical protein
LSPEISVEQLVDAAAQLRVLSKLVDKVKGRRATGIRVGWNASAEPVALLVV